MLISVPCGVLMAWVGQAGLVTTVGEEEASLSLLYIHFSWRLNMRAPYKGHLTSSVIRWITHPLAFIALQEEALNSDKCDPQTKTLSRANLSWNTIRRELIWILEEMHLKAGFLYVGLDESPSLPLGSVQCLHWLQHQSHRLSTCWADWCCRAPACVGTGWSGPATPGFYSQPLGWHSPEDSPPPKGTQCYHRDSDNPSQATVLRSGF